MTYTDVFAQLQILKAVQVRTSAATSSSMVIIR